MNGFWRSIDLLRDQLGLPRSTASQEPLAAALLAHYEGDRAVEFTAERGRDFRYTISSSEFFQLDGPLADLDRRALDEARGRVLDVGAGAGRHALALQARGLEVVAVDVSPTCVDLMRRRGVEHAYCSDAFGVTEGSFDTILLLMQSIGIAGSFFGLEVLLCKLAERLEPDGQILLDSSELLLIDRDEPVDDGGIEVRFRYRNLRGRPFRWLYVAEDELVELVEPLGWCCEVLERVGDDAEYLARLTRAGG